MITVTGMFKRERACKHSVRYQPSNDSAKAITSLLYIKNATLAELDNPSIIEVSIKKMEQL